MGGGGGGLGTAKFPCDPPLTSGGELEAICSKQSRSVT